MKIKDKKRRKCKIIVNTSKETAARAGGCRCDLFGCEIGCDQLVEAGFCRLLSEDVLTIHILADVEDVEGFDAEIDGGQGELGVFGGYSEPNVASIERNIA